MLPSKDDIASFIAFAPNASEGVAFMFLEVSPAIPSTLLSPPHSTLLMRLSKEAGTVEEAVDRFYENPNKYSSTPPPAPRKPSPVGSAKNTKDTKASRPPDYSPPLYTPPGNTLPQTRGRPHTHTNIVIEAGNIRARDEVRLTLEMCAMLVF